jgi:hypothetical protein
VEVIPYQIGTHVRPCDGEAVAGDAIVVKHCADGIFLSLIDVVGHGREAAEVALQAIRFLKQNASADVIQVLGGLNENLKGSRGAMAVIAFAYSSSGIVHCTGIGNSTIRRFGRREESFPCPDGVVGVRFRTPRLNEFRLESGEFLLMHSDGVAESLSSAIASTLANQPVDVIARRIVLDHGRLYDDAACIVARYEP